MTALYLDEDVPIALGGLLSARGHIIFTTRTESRLGSNDPDQRFFAANRGLVIVTHNRDDFGLLHQAWLVWTQQWGLQRPHAGIIVLGRVLNKPTGEYADLIGDLLATPQLMLTDTFYRWHPHSGWTQTP